MFDMWSTKTIMLESYFGVLVLFLMFCLECSVVNSFNLDVRIPLVKTGTKGTYFGYSVAEHKYMNSATVTPW